MREVRAADRLRLFSLDPPLRVLSNEEAEENLRLSDRDKEELAKVSNVRRSEPVSFREGR